MTATKKSNTKETVALYKNKAYVIGDRVTYMTPSRGEVWATVRGVVNPRTGTGDKEPVLIVKPDNRKDGRPFPNHTLRPSRVIKHDITPQIED